MRLPHSLRSNAPTESSACVSPYPENNVADRLNLLLSSSGAGYTLSLCPGQEYVLTASLFFTAPNQEISTANYPTDSTRATLVVAGPVSNGQGHTTAVTGTCGNCDGVKLRNVQVNGSRLGAPAISGGANIEMGGPNTNQVIEYVHSYDPRGWSCLHVSQGNLGCSNTVVQYNEIGPAGSDLFQQWADGISFGCKNGVVRNNMINNPTDGGIVLFGSPGTRVEHNTIWVEKHTLLGGVNLVDARSYDGNFRDVVVTNNTIAGGFSSQVPQGSESKGTNDNDVIIKIGIAIGPRTWFTKKYGNHISNGGTVQNNQLTGAFSFGIALAGAANFTVENNVLVANTSFIGIRGPNCSANDTTPSPGPFVIDTSTVKNCTTQSDFTPIPDGDRLICLIPPHGGSLWPFGENPGSSASPVSPPEASPTSSGHAPVVMTAGSVGGAAPAVLLVAAITWFVRKWVFNRSQARMCPGRP